MKKTKIGVLLLVLSLAAGGCGEKPITMTQDEEAMIVAYAAHVVSKFNTRQPDGLSHVPIAVYEKKTMGETEQLEEPDTEEVPEESVNEPEGNEDSQTGNQGETERQEDQEPVSVSLAEALGLSGITAECTGTELKASYAASSVALDASAGNTFLILHITLANETDQEIACDVLSQKLTFRAQVNGDVQTQAKTTILLNDLGTYQDAIGAGASVETLLFFEVPSEEVSSVESLRITIEKDGSSMESVL